jgi:hypothetical protein
MALYMVKCQGDVSVFLCMGANRAGSPPYEAVTHTLGPSGHDGQFYYAIARSPWSRHGADIDLPAGRHLRIFYPAVCWMLSVGGRPVLLLYVMPLVNLLAIAGIAAIGVRLARLFGRSPWWGFVLPLGLNLGISLLHDFTDCVSSLAVVGLLASWIMGQRWWAVASWAALAMLSREQNVAAAGLVGLAALWQGRWAVAAGVAAAGGVWLGWVATLWSLYEVPPFLVGCNFSAPFTGLLYRFQHLGDTGHRISTRLAIVHLLSTLHLIALLAFAAAVLLQPSRTLVRLMIAAGFTLAVLGSSNIYIDFASYLRVFIWVPLGLWLVGLQTGRTRVCWLLLPGALWSLVAALRYV